MNKRTFLPLLLLFAAPVVLAQESTEQDLLMAAQPRLSTLDSLKLTFVHHEEAACLDSLWMSELANTELSDEMFSDISKINPDEKVDYDLSTDLLKERLAAMDAKSPFNIEYNQGLENVIKSFLKNRKRSYERLMAVSEFYFPMFETALAKYNVPLEIKYLAIIESALNPRAKSRVGAAGLWQFMYATGKQYNLDVTSYVDERSDPLKATEAACQYLSGLYNMFGDWDLVLASYNAGPGNVTKAIRRSNGQKNYWNIRKNLPKETQGYLPAFLATMYIYEYHKEHGINPKKAPVAYLATDTIMVKKKMTFKQVSQLLDVPVAQLQFMNPGYKLDVIPFENATNHYLRLPVDKIGLFTSNEDKIYAYIQSEDNKRERPYESAYASRSTSAPADSSRAVASTNVAKTKTKFHTVKRGDTLGQIASRYGVSLAQVKSWNKLRSNNVPLGRKLKIVQQINAVEIETAVAVAEPKVEKTKAKEGLILKKEIEKTSDIYVVQNGDNLNKIAQKFGVSVEDLKKWNNLKTDTAPLGKKLKTVVDNEAIAQNDGDAKEGLIIDKEIDLATATDYVVKAGDNLGKIAQKYNVTIDDLRKWNDMEDNTVKVGNKLKIITNDVVASVDVKETKTVKSTKKEFTPEKEQFYTVKKGDSLYTISKKYPGVSITDIKKWNGISGESIKPGMKLKING
ncbi:LysM peptidoglycan-binding domain-containing protein [Flavobacterium kingsejongi]|uniref:Lytic transglycosylase n=1 Tax=Flavobacterium kingsejongi TaxID=1678728 RepID=A0A2S1LLB1_9FLAO|nr:LysM peptidoglycan-binding domain-containing protein [Flavobacterium kingsejongi]AWG24508.1 lytic transglycosylase [Flavobacterium kingsejongi]